MLPLVAVDVGNRRMKFGWFGRSWAEPHPPGQLPEPDSILYLPTSGEAWDRLEAWLELVRSGDFVGQAQGPFDFEQTWAAGLSSEPSRSPGPSSDRPRTAGPTADPSRTPEHTADQPWTGGQTPGPASAVPTPTQEVAWWIGSVNRPAAARLVGWIARRWPRQPPKLLQWTDLPLQLHVQEPHRVGIDRLLNAVATNRLRAPDRPAVVVDVGTAITVDWLSAEGAFCGGAILPGLEMAAKALHQFTDLLPEVSFAQEAEPPPVLGSYTEAAIRSGLFWGTLGAVRELTVRLAQQASVPPQVFLTGGAGALLAPQLGPEVHYVPHLTLAGIALCACASRSTA